MSESDDKDPRVFMPSHTHTSPVAGVLGGSGQALGGATRPQQMAPVEEQLGILEAQIEAIINAVGILVNRLEPVLAPNPPAPTEPQSEQPALSSTALRLYRASHALMDLRSAVEYTVERIEI